MMNTLSHKQSSHDVSECHSTKQCSSLAVDMQKLMLEEIQSLKLLHNQQARTMSDLRKDMKTLLDKPACRNADCTDGEKRVQAKFKLPLHVLDDLEAFNELILDRRQRALYVSRILIITQQFSMPRNFNCSTSCHVITLFQESDRLGNYINTIKCYSDALYVFSGRNRLSLRGSRCQTSYESHLEGHLRPKCGEKAKLEGCGGEVWLVRLPHSISDERYVKMYKSGHFPSYSLKINK